MVKVWTLFLCLLTPTAYAYNFKYIKLEKSFKDYLIRVNQPAAHGFVAKSSADDAMEIRMRKALLGATYLEGRVPVKAANFAASAEEPPLYEEIRESLQQSHQSIGLEEVTRIDRINREFNLGKENFSGFSWQKPFGSVQVFVDRQVTPNLEADSDQSQWLVQDTFTFDIEATSYLESLKNSGLANMDATQIGAFAGITFRRVYTYYHYASSYQAGLSADFSKLFLPFIRFSRNGIDSLATNEIIKREDKFTAKAGGLITTPPVYNVSFSAGVLAEADLEQGTSFQRQPGQVVVGARRKASKKAGAVLQLQLDFFNLLKLSLVRAEMSYTYTEGKEFTLGFDAAEWQAANTDENEGQELKTLFQGMTDIKHLEKYVIRLDESTSENIETYGTVLLWGRLGKSKTETQRIIKDGQVHVFYKSVLQTTKSVQTLLSRLISEVLYAFLKLPIGTKDEATHDKRVVMEFKDTHPQAGNVNVQRVKSPDDFSFHISRSIEVSGRKGKLPDGYKGDLAWFISEYTTLPKNYVTDVRQNKLLGPIRVDSNLRVDKAGFLFFVKQPIKDIFGTLVNICGSKKLKEWQDEVERTRMLSTNHSNNEDACVKHLGRKYVDFMEDFEANYQMPSLAHLRSFILDYVSISESAGDLVSLFGKDNVFHNGEINAKLPKGGNFRDLFSRGQFRGYGVIDNFKRAGGTRTPASISSE